LLVPMPYILDLVLSIAGLNYLWSSLIGFLHAQKDEAEEKIETLEAELKEFKERHEPATK
jgi:hypothetical protein